MSKQLAWKKLAGGALLVSGLRVFSAILVYLTHLMLARWMGPAELGQYAYALSLLTLISVGATLGLGRSSMRFIPGYLATDEVALARGFFQFSRRFVLVFGVVLAGTAIAFVSHTGLVPSESTRLLAVAALAIPAHAVLLIQNNLARSLSRIGLAFMPEWFWRNMLLLLAIVVTVVGGRELSAEYVMACFVGVVLLVTFVQGLLLSRVARRAFLGAPAIAQPKNWLVVSAPLLFVALFATYLSDLSLLLSGFFVSDGEIGVYNAALRTANLMVFGIAALSSLVAPRLSHLYAEGKTKELQHLTTLASRLSFWSACGLLLLVWLFADLILGLFGEEFLSGKPTLIMLAAGHLAGAAIGPALILLTVAGQERRCLKFALLGTSVCITVHLLLLPLMGVEGAAIALAIARVAWALLLYVEVLRQMQIRSGFWASLGSTST